MSYSFFFYFFLLSLFERIERKRKKKKEKKELKEKKSFAFFLMGTVNSSESSLTNTIVDDVLDGIELPEKLKFINLPSTTDEECICLICKHNMSFYQSLPCQCRWLCVKCLPIFERNPFWQCPKCKKQIKAIM